MSSELAYLSTASAQAIDNLHDRIFQVNAVPFAYDVDSRPHKRLRPAARNSLQIHTNRHAPSQTASLPSAQSLNGSFPSNALTPADGQGSHRRSASVPPQGRSGGRKKSSKPTGQHDPFIQESFAFPKQQTWLKVKSRQRKAAVEVQEIAPVVVPCSNAPQEGEALCLDKHADRIAALIAQKRKDNESKLFRERMSLQQRLHRGEEDDKDKAIAASHDKLKRKMELSAKGIFEEQPPNGKEPVFALAEQPPRPPTGPDTDAAEGRSEHCSTIVLAGRSSAQDDTPADQVRCEARLNHADADEQVQRGEEPSARDPRPGTSDYTEFAPSTYYQTQTTVTTQTFAFSNAPARPQAVQYFFTQPRFTNQRTHNPRFWQQDPVPPGTPREWPSRAFNALPSTSTPVLETREVALRPQSSNTVSAAPPTSDDEPSFNLFSSGASPPADESASSALLNRLAASKNDSSRFDPTPPVLRSNMNMFTRQARENGVIGGNNNYVAPLGEGGRRRNMFDARN